AYEYKIGFSNRTFDGNWQDGGITPQIEYTSSNFNLLRNIGGRLEFRYCTGLNLSEGAGIRIKRISDYTSTSDTLPKIRKYYYNSFKDRYRSPPLSQRLLTPMFHDYFVVNGDYPCGGTTIYYDGVFMTLSSKPFAQLNYSSNFSAHNYEYVTIGFGENFENGAVEKKFSGNWYKMGKQFDGNIMPTSGLDYRQIAILTIRAFKGMHDGARWNTEVNDGQLLQETVFENKDGWFAKVKSTKYEYQNYLYDSVDNLRIIKLYDCPGCFGNTGYHHYFG